MKKIFIIMYVFVNALLFSYDLDNTTWVVKRVEIFDGVIHGSVDETVIGKILEYTNDSIVFDNITYKIKSERVEYWSEDDLYWETRGSQSRGVTFNDIPAQEKTLCTISYRTEGGERPFGSRLFIISDNSILIGFDANMYYWCEKI